MKKNILLIFTLIFNIWTVFSQHVYYGLPNDVSLKKGDIIVVNIPPFYMTSYHFIQGKQLEDLVSFFKRNDTLTFSIEINYCLGRYSDTSFCADITDHLRDHLIEEFQSRNLYQRYRILSKGLENPLYQIRCTQKGRERIKYEYYNTRLEIIVE